MVQKLLNIESVSDAKVTAVEKKIQEMVGVQVGETAEFTGLSERKVRKRIRDKVRAALAERLEDMSTTREHVIITCAKQAILAAVNELVDGTNVDHDDSGKGDWSGGEVSDTQNTTGGGNRVVWKMP